MKVVSIIYKRKGNRYIVKFENNETIEVLPEFLYMYGIKEGGDIEDVEEIKRKSAILICKEYALRVLKDRMYSKRDMELKLKRRCPNVCYDVLKELELAGFIDDREYCRVFFEEQLNKKRSKKDIEIRLKRKGINEEIIKEVENEIFSHEKEVDNLQIIANKYWQKIKNKDRPYMRLFRYLLSKGFEYEDVDRVVNSFKEDL